MTAAADATAALPLTARLELAMVDSTVRVRWEADCGRDLGAIFHMRHQGAETQPSSAVMQATKWAALVMASSASATVTTAPGPTP